MAAARCSCGIAATGNRDDPGEGLQEGRSQIHARRRKAARQLGAGADAPRPQRRQAHQLAADQASRRISRRKARATTFSTRIESVASGRAMEQIAAGKGRAPKPFMLAKNGRGKPDAVWNSNRGDGRRRAGRTRAEQASHKADSPQIAEAAVAAMPDFVAPQLCDSVERPPGGDGWVHEIKFDGYRVQLRVEDGEATLEDPQGAGLDRKIRRHRRRRPSALPDALIDGEIVALDDKGDPDFAALQAALSDGKTDNLIFFAFDLLFADEYDLRALPLVERKAAVARNCWKARDSAKAEPDPLSSIISRPAARRSANRPARCRWKASSRRSSTRPIGPAGPKTGPRPSAAPAMRSSSAAGRPPTANSAR